MASEFTAPLKVVFVATEDLDEPTRAAIIAVCNAAFQREDFRRLFSFIPSGGRHFLAYCENELVSHAVVTTRWLQPAGQRVLKTAYVDAVATLPAYQGRGYGSAVMQHLAANISDYSIACLQTKSPGFYERMGWQAWRGPLAGRRERGLVPTPDQRGIMIFRLAGTPPLDLEALLTIECQSERIW
jgi:aminoglycoside 2'-N-acetyltransferase I